MAESTRRRRRALSLTWRLVSAYTLAATATLSIVAVYLHRGLRQSFEQEDAELLSDCVASVRREIRNRKGDLHEAEEIIAQSAGDRQIEKYYGRLLHQDGKILVETPG